jgi:hypothetical protein
VVLLFRLQLNTFDAFFATDLEALLPQLESLETEALLDFFELIALLFLINLSRLGISYRFLNTLYMVAKSVAEGKHLTLCITGRGT